MAEHEILQEVLQRVTRLESRMVQLGDYVGANLRSKQKVIFSWPPNQRPIAAIDALDMSLSRVIAELDTLDAPTGDIDVVCKGSRVAILFYQHKEHQHG